MGFIGNHLLGIIFGFVLFIGILLWKELIRVLGGVVIPPNQLGVVIKNFSIFGKGLPDGQIIALNHEAGIQADTLPPGLKWRYWPWQYTVKLLDFTIIDKGYIGIVTAKDGSPLSGGRVLGKNVDCNAFQDARKFLTNGGQRGPQITIIPPGTYRINKLVFDVTSTKVTEIPDNMIGIVTTKDGAPLSTGDIAGPEVSGHNMFQDAETFIKNGGRKGLQEQVLLAGTWFINPMFAEVDKIPLTEVPMAHVAAVISYVGERGADISGDSFQHANLVEKLKRGVWAEPFDPGMYPINTNTCKVELVPTANIVLNWATGKTESHNLDANLSTINVRSSDGFKFMLDVSQIIHIPRNSAPKVIARFGTVANLVTQVLEPTIGNYFRNAAQSSDVIEFLRNRETRQQEAKEAISSALKEYDVIGVDTLIGDIDPPEPLMKTLTDRKIAEQEQVTYKTQEAAQQARKEMKQAEAMADTQPKVVDAERSVSIAEFTAKAAIAKAEGDAKAKTVNAEADANVLTVTGNAQAEKTLAIGNAEAEVIQRKTNAVGAGNYALIEVGRALAENKIKLVPEIMAGGGSEGGGTLVNVLLANLVSKNMKTEETSKTE